MDKVEGKTFMNRRRKESVRTIFTGLVAMLTIAGCGSEAEGPKAAPAPAVQVAVMEPQALERRLMLTGTVEASTVATLSSPAEGPVQALRIREGDAVEAGELLLVIGREASAEAMLISAMEEVNRQEKEFERVDRLVRDRALAAEKLDAARAGLERARAELAQAEQASRDFTVQAPWAGVVSRLHVADGRYLAPRAPLLDLFDPQSLVLRFQVPEEHAFHMGEGDPLRASFDAFGGQTLALTVTRAWPELDRRLRTRTFEADLPLGELPFAPGQFARITVVLETVEAALAVPVEALLFDPKGTTRVLIVDADGRARVVEVVTGFEEAGRVLIREGLQLGDRVIVNGLEQVKPDQPVRLLPGKGQGS